MAWNVVSQSGFRIFLLTISLEEINEAAWSFSKIFWVGMVKNYFISRTNRWSELIFCMLVQIQESCFNDFWVSMVKNGCGLLVHETLKSDVCYKWVHELSWFIACWLWCNNILSDRHCNLYFWLLNASLLQLYLLDQNGYMKWGLSNILSCCLFRCFFGIWSLVFCEFWCGARNT